MGAGVPGCEQCKHCSCWYDRGHCCTCAAELNGWSSAEVDGSYAQAHNVAAAVTAPTADSAATDTSAEPPPSTDTEGRGGQGVRGDDLTHLLLHPKSGEPTPSTQRCKCPPGCTKPYTGHLTRCGHDHCGGRCVVDVLHPKNHTHGPLTRGDWHCEEYGPDSRGPRCWFYSGADLRRGLPLQSRQDCDDLIALLTEVRERLP